jgi:hypothetical protein
MMKEIVSFPVALLCAALSADAQQADPLQQQLQQLKQQYIDTTRELEQRIASLERQIAEQKDAKPKEGVVSTTELAAEGGRKVIKQSQVGKSADSSSSVPRPSRSSS